MTVLVLSSLIGHDINVYDDAGNLLFVLQPSGKVARVRPRAIQTLSVNGIPLTRTQNVVVDLPKPKKGVLYVVSNSVAQAMAGSRKDLIAPDTGETALRDENNKVIGIRRFQAWSLPIHSRKL